MKIIWNKSKSKMNFKNYKCTVMYAGIDVGLKNLAICVIDPEKWKNYKKVQGPDSNPGIVFWANVNLLADTRLCKALIKSGKNKGQECGAKACRQACRQEDAGNFFCARHAPENCKIYKPEELKKLSLTTLEKRAVEILDNIPELTAVKTVVIETQPQKSHRMMRMFAAALQMYFVIRGMVDSNNLKVAKSSSAKNKLKVYQGPWIDTSHITDPYKKRKYLAQKHTEYFLRDSPEILDQYYWPNTKKDDLADAFLHCLFAVK